MQAHAKNQNPKLIASSLHFGDSDGFSEPVIDLAHAVQEELCGSE